MRDRILRAARIYDRQLERDPGRRRGPLGLIALEIYEWFVCLNANSARLEPSISYLAKKFRHSRSTIVAALAALRDHGFLRWVRRYTVARSAGEKGPQIAQATNAYRVELPDEAAKLLQPAPEPDDEAARKSYLAARLRQMDAQASGLDAVLDKLGAAVHEKERSRS